MKYTSKSFAHAVGSDAYRENFDRIFRGARPAEPPECATCAGFGNIDTEDAKGRRLEPCPDCGAQQPPTAG